MWVGLPRVCACSACPVTLIAYCPNWSGKGCFMCLCGKTLIAPPFLQLGQPCVHITPHFASSTAFPGEAAPYKHEITPYSFHSGQPCLWVPQFFASSVLSPAGGGPTCMNITLPYPLDQSPGGRAPCKCAMVPSCSRWI